MNRISFYALAAAALGLAGCATPDQQVQRLKTENEALQSQVQERDGKIQTLSDANQQLEVERSYYAKRSEVLDREKAARIAETTTIRKGMRDFTDEVVKIIQSQYQRLDIVDYIGSEICPRDFVDEGGGKLLVDMEHPLESNATLIGGRAFASAPGRVQFCLIRPHEDGRGEIVAVTTDLSAGEAGKQAWDFKLPLAAKKGDVIGLYLPDSPIVSYDKSDTGKVLVFNTGVKQGAFVKLEASVERGKRTYSFGAVGYFQ